MKRRSFLQALGFGPAAAAVGIAATKTEAIAKELKFDAKVAALREPVTQFNGWDGDFSVDNDFATCSVGVISQPIHLRKFDEL